MRIDEELTNRSVVLVAAHPDDETIGAGGLLPQMRDPLVVHLTDGAPHNPADAHAAQCNTREGYARARREEFLAAIEVAGIAPERTRAWNIVDQEASYEMAYLTLRLVDLIKQVRPSAILTHPYEGGHPDHDAAAFAVHAACARVPSPPVVFEFTSYHALVTPDSDRVGLEVGKFLNDTDPGEPVVLSEEARLRKSRMLSCFRSQLHVLRNFPVDTERYREAPTYDFTQAPHPGRLFYENFDWGVTGERWRYVAEEALRTLGASAL